MKIRLGFIGMGRRGLRHLAMLSERADCAIVAIAEPLPAQNALAQKILAQKTHRPIFYDKNEQDYQRMIAQENLDAVLIYTPWKEHLAQSQFAMQHGVRVGVEVSGAQSLEECWQFVETYEQTQTPIMLLENCCYRRDVLAIAQMIKNGDFGELVYLKGGYQHDIRSVLFDEKLNFGAETQGESNWRTQEYLERNADIYPTHGLGPMAIFNDINAGNRITQVRSLATKSVGMKNFCQKNIAFKLGDIVLTQMQCERGEVMQLTHDTSLPRPFNLGLMVQGSKGIWQEYYRGDLSDGQIYLEKNDAAAPLEKRWQSPKKYLRKNDSSIWVKFRKKITKFGRYGIDYIMLNDFIERIQQGKEFRIDVYDLATWKAITPLSEQSIQANGKMIEMPDFTKGKYIDRKNKFKNYE
ncbi:Gfo/Idh/MocA family oxidoreductase [Ornithobacterium rhinotracheale]|uniref:Gfo/Idh/MocA family oxidoreductase n=1 Tax=Ornithobacterium rhinotracheale TaxID=28251 RepID=A0A3R5UTC9_ORNRH|nr:Gfo/Idh/MocA family oxidoreductase [Ornithobacterium rhinotracheale]QAR30059.1 Gfo/Idh/MocA family oxidoreductase [Ornithobacterium rhinotracheale]